MNELREAQTQENLMQKFFRTVELTEDQFIQFTRLEFDNEHCVTAVSILATGALRGHVGMTCDRLEQYADQHPDGISYVELVAALRDLKNLGFVGYDTSLSTIGLYMFVFMTPDYVLQLDGENYTIVEATNA